MGREAGDGIEPTHGAFAEPGLTTWLPRHFSRATAPPDARQDGYTTCPGTATVFWRLAVEADDYQKTVIGGATVVVVPSRIVPSD